LSGSDTIKPVPRLPSNPSMSDIHHFLTRTMENRGEVIEISWYPPDGAIEYRLKVQSSPRGGDAEWSMFAGSGKNSSMLWAYVSCDVLLVYNLVLQSTGQSKNAGPGGGRDQNGGNLRSEDSVYKLDSYAGSPNASPTRSSGGYPAYIEASQMPAKSGKSKSVRSRSALNGDLAHVQMPTLLQSVLMAKMTGCLEVKLDDAEAEIFFVNGVPTHARAGHSQSVGEEILFELLGWKEGDFHFEPEKQIDEITIKQPLDSLLLQGMQLIDNEAYLTNAGLRPGSVITAKHAGLSAMDFQSIVSNGAPLNMAVQKDFYQSIDGLKTAEQIARSMKLPRSRWVPIMCNMLRCDLITINAGMDGQKLVSRLEPKAIDKRAIHNVMMSLRRSDTGMFTYPAFLYFLEQEYFRAYRSASPLSVVIFQMRMKSQDPNDPVREPLTFEALSEAVRRMSRVKRNVDLLSHYETFDYAFLLPNTKSVGVEAFIRRITKAVTEEPLIPGAPRDCVEMTFGSACIPEDTLELSLLLSAAEVAKNAAQHTESQLVFYHELI
jgi:GGDEF domain-containing protein